MKQSIVTIILLMAIGCGSCNHSGKNLENGADQKSKTVFPKGDKIANSNFTGTAFLQMLVQTDTIYNTQIGNATFQPGARSHWHSHPGGQILLVTNGTGYYQESGKPKQVLHTGDVIKCLPGVVHWHGASPDSEFSHIAISPNTQKGSVLWLKPVADEEYSKSF